MIAGLDLAGLAVFVQRDGDAGGGGVAVAVEIENDAAFFDAEAFAHGIDDAQISLVGNDPLELVSGQSGKLEGTFGRGVHRANGVAVDFLAGHVDGVLLLREDIGCDRHATAARRHVEDVGLCAVGSHVGSEDAVFAFGGGLHDDRACAVTKKHAGVAVFPVDDGGKFFSADDEHRLVHVGGDELLGNNHAVEKSGAGGLEVEGGGTRCADGVLDAAGGGGENGVGRAGGQDDEIDVVGGDACVLDGDAGGGGGHVGGEFVVGGNAALANTGAGENPLVSGVDHLFEVGIGKDALGEVGTGANNGYIAPGVCGPGMRPVVICHGCRDRRTWR